MRAEWVAAVAAIIRKKFLSGTDMNMYKVQQLGGWFFSDWTPMPVEAGYGRGAEVAAVGSDMI